MCCFSRKVDVVADTNIFARASSQGRQFLVYSVSGAIAGLCGYLWVARHAIAYTEVAYGFELTVIAACVIGGVSIAGGIGSVTGAVLGALFLGIINNALPVINVSPFWQMAISGSVIILAVIFNARQERRKGRIILRDKGAKTYEETIGKEATA